MKRVVWNAVLIVVVAIAVWVYKGEAQDTGPAGPFTITCTGGTVLFSSSVEGNGVTSQLKLMTGVFANQSPYAAELTDCLLWAPTPTEGP